MHFTKSILTIVIILVVNNSSWAQNNNCVFDARIPTIHSQWVPSNAFNFFYNDNVLALGWFGYYEFALSDMSDLGSVGFFFDNVGEYSADPLIAPTSDNGVNEFWLGDLGDPLLLGFQISSSKTPVPDEHEEADISMNIGPKQGWDWKGSGGLIDEETLIRHELGHTYGIPDAPPTTVLGGELMNVTSISTGAVRYADTCIENAIDCIYSGTSCSGVQFGTGGSTPVFLSYTEASFKDNCLVIKFQGAQQIGWLGFDILRSEEGGQHFRTINQEMLETVGDELREAQYEFVDPTANPAASYTYVIRIHTLDGILEEEPFFYEGSTNK